MSAPPKQPPVRLTVCTICTDTGTGSEAGIGGGGRLHGLLYDRLTGHAAANAVEIDAYRCLMACPEGCVASVAQPGKIRYLLGRLPATDDKALELLDFAALYHASPTGIVANHRWPGTLAMHFLGRIPPLSPNPEGDWTQTGCDL